MFTAFMSTQEGIDTYLEDMTTCGHHQCGNSGTHRRR
jgi:hypothetical protein